MNEHGSYFPHRARKEKNAIGLPVTLGRSINPTLYTPTDWLVKKAAGNSFVLRVSEQDKINLIGGPPPQEPAHEQ